MTGKKEDGGQAFPSRQIAYHKTSYSGSTPTNIEPVYEDAPGMTLRDHYASHAPITFETALELETDGKKLCDLKPCEIDMVYTTLAQMRYAYADAMLKERAK